MRASLITGLAGTRLMPDEARFLAGVRPCGLILFARNCEAPDQVRRLVADAKEAIGSDQVLVLVDQEGGRVRRLRPPHWRELPPAAAFARMSEADPDQAARAAWLVARLTAAELIGLGINTNCAPVLDIPIPGSHEIIGDRAYGTTPEAVARLGRAVAEGHLAGGVLPVVKHIPGHGRARADSHLELPVVATPREELSATDFAPFRALRDMPAAMTAHVVFSDIDPGSPASTSEIVTREVIRGEIGFDGLLMSDDLSMRALSGSMWARTEAVIRAGSDVALHCNGCLPEMEQAAAGVPALSGQPQRRFERCVTVLSRAERFDVTEAEAALARALLAAA
ncbi:MAG: beta-N-acetylhexosaminidase [Hyphomicrobiaceae bacterium]|nr:beta-N-acetylhexosaminidase [Hyphomicrobiaceae bacterium]